MQASRSGAHARHVCWHSHKSQKARKATWTLSGTSQSMLCKSMCDALTTFTAMYSGASKFRIRMRSPSLSCTISQWPSSLYFTSPCSAEWSQCMISCLLSSPSSQTFSGETFCHWLGQTPQTPKRSATAAVLHAPVILLCLLYGIRRNGLHVHCKHCDCRQSKNCSVACNNMQCSTVIDF